MKVSLSNIICADSKELAYGVTILSCESRSYLVVTIKQPMSMDATATCAARYFQSMLVAWSSVASVSHVTCLIVCRLCLL
jgi:hypothetical protein